MHGATINVIEHIIYMCIFRVLLHNFKCSLNSRTWNTLDIITYTQETQGLKYVGDSPHAIVSNYSAVYGLYVVKS
jgi:hypothetical protein